ncbi:MAG: shikimate dehydrogenase [Acetobacterales bacterium]
MTEPPRTLTGRTRLAGVLGWPVAHSRSPRLHGYWLWKHGIDGAYLPLPVRAQDFDRAVRAVAALCFAGANVTVPHKAAALALADEADSFARRVGAANTLVFGPDGRIVARNTDGYGFIESLRQQAPGWHAAAGPAVVLGAGGASRAILAALSDAGVPTLRLANRTRGRAEAVAHELGGVEVVAWEERMAALEDASLLVNATSLGLEGKVPLDIDIARLPSRATVCDIVYVPLETPLLAAARACGLAAVDGLGMLLHQARPGFASWFGGDPVVDDELRSFVAADLMAAR